MNGYLLDTNVVSETRKRRADDRVLAFLSAADASRLFLSALTVGELHKGVLARQRTDPYAAAGLASWVEGIETAFADRIIGIDAAVARLWGELSVDRPRPVIDTLIAATALAHGLTLVTRDGQDLAGIEVPLLDPWRS